MSATTTTHDDAVGRIVGRPHLLLIDGEHVEAADGQTFEVFDPATGDLLTHVAAGGPEDVDRAAAAARRALEHGPWATMPPAQRGAILWRIADLIDEHADELAYLEALDNGKAKAIARAADVPLAADMFRYMAGWATKIEGSTIPISAPGEHLTYTLRQPVGVVGQIIPWNFPLLMAAWKVAPALAAGCTVVLKPAEQTPLTASVLGELMLEAGLPAGVVNIVHGLGERAGAAIAAHPGIDKVAFTGSTEVGRLIVQAATGNLKRVSLELGGKSPTVVFDDADLETAIPSAAAGIFFNQGEVCTAGSRLYVHRDVFDDVVAGVADAAKNIKIGSGLDPETEMGPLVSAEQLDRVEGYLDVGRREGAEIVTGGNRHGDKGYFIEPTVLVNTRADMTVVREEIFGPVVAAMPFASADEIPAVANDSMYGLAAGIFTRDISTAHRMAARIGAGTVWVNTFHVYDAAMPFGGFKQSGWGREKGAAALEQYLETKTVCVAL